MLFIVFCILPHLTHSGILFGVSAPSDPPPPPPQKKKKKKKNQNLILCQNSITIELNIKVVGFVLKQLLAYFEMLIVPHAPHCVDSCIFVFYLIRHSLAYCFGFSAPPPPPSPFPQFFFIRFSYFVKIHLLESSL